mgnify:FL=1
MGMEERTALLLGAQGMEKLAGAHVLLFGLGGVGSYTAEALARSGVGALTLVDDDVVAESNLNRQLVALRSTLGQSKAEVAARRIADIAPGCRVTPVRLFYTPETADQLSFAGYDYVIDAVDTVSAKLEIIRRAKEAGVPVISCMGTGNKLHPEKLEVTWLDKTQGCPLARVMRRECKARGLGRVRVVYSTEPPIRHAGDTTPQAAGDRPGNAKKSTPGSAAFVPGCAGLMLAAEVVRAIAGAE